jgi:tetratricopeptide (TPR) repeat protein
MTATRRLFVTLACVLWLAGVGPARAQQASQGEVKTAAVAHYERGRLHFNAGRYREAISELKAALALDPDSPTLMYNVAYANELLGRLDQARHYYRRYLAALPADETAERAKTKATLARLQGRKQQIEKRKRDADDEPVEDDSVSGRADAWFWASLGGGAALIAGGAVTGLLALDREDEVSGFVAGENGSVRRRMQLADDADSLAVASDVLFAGGAVLVTTAALLYFLRDEDTEEDPKTARLSLGADGSGVRLSVRATF